MGLKEFIKVWCVDRAGMLFQKCLKLNVPNFQS